MKLPGYILLTYLLFLSVFPCCAVDDCPDDKIAVTNATDQHSNGDEDCGTCSPFFSCAGCASVTAVPASYQLTANNISCIIDYNDFPPFTIPQITIGVWQPPQI